MFTKTLHSDSIPKWLQVIRIDVDWVTGITQPLLLVPWWGFYSKKGLDTRKLMPFFEAKLQSVWQTDLTI